MVLTSINQANAGLVKDLITEWKECRHDYGPSDYHVNLDWLTSREERPQQPAVRVVDMDNGNLARLLLKNSIHGEMGTYGYGIRRSGSTNNRAQQQPKKKSRYVLMHGIGR